MAPKPLILLHQPSELEEERQQSSEDESEEREQSDESEEEQENHQENSSDDESEEATDDDDEVQGTPSTSKYQIPAPKSDSKLISPRNGSDSDPDSEGTTSDYRLQPIRKGSMSSSKRSREEDDEIQDFSTGNRSSRVGAGCINRLWNDEDEIAVLNGMIEFKTLKGVAPTADMGRFHSFIKGKLNVDFSKEQLKSKIIRLKKRFLNALKKGSNGGSLKPHEVMAFEISKKIWGGAVDGGSNEDVKKKRKKVEKHEVDERGAGEEESVGGGEGFLSKHSYLHASLDNMNGAFRSRMLPVGGKSLLEEKLGLIGNVKAKELDDKWKQLCVEETQLSIKILMLMKEQVQLVLDQK